MTKARIVGEGRYRLQSVIGRGAHGEVYQALDLDTDERVALKLIRVEGENKNIAETLFRKETDALEGLNHPHIVKMLSSFVNDDRSEFGIVLELVQGGLNLGSFLEEVAFGRQARRDVPWRIKRLLDILGAVKAAHARNIVHRDLKPTNILYSPAGLKVTDFGIARVLKHYAAATPDLTLRSYCTPPYASREQLDQEEATFASDLYAFGVLAVALLTFRLPEKGFKRSHLPERLQALRDEMDDKHATTYQSLAELIDQLMEEQPVRRPHLPEIQFALEQALNDLTEKPTVGVHLTWKAKDCLADINPRYRNNESLALEDLNASLCGTYRMEERDGERRSRVYLYGRTLQVTTVLDSADQEQLVAVDIRTHVPEIHENRRKEATPLPFLLDFGKGNAKNLLDLLYDHQHEQMQVQEEQQERQEIFKIASLLLQSQRRRLARVALACTREAPGDTEGWHDDREFLVLHIVAAKPLLENEEPAFSSVTSEITSLLEDELLNVLNEQAIAKLKRTVIGRVHNFNAKTRTLVIRREKNTRIPDEDLVLTITNGATESSLSRQEYALRQFIEGKTVNERLSELITHPERNRVDSYMPVELIQTLEPRRDTSDLVGRILSARDVFLVQGPPGTGKTTLIAEVMAQILNENPVARILLTSQANEAVNNALDALRDLAKKHQKDWTILRDVSERRADKDARYGLDQSFSDWAIATEVNSQRACRFYEEQQGTNAVRVKSILKKWTDNLEKYSDVKRDYATAAHVYGATCLRVPALDKVLSEVEFDWVIVDEAAKATPSEVLVSIIRGKRILLVGDHRQLPPYLDTEAADDLKEKNIELEEARRSLFEDLFSNIPSTNKYTLRRQYRMHSSIAVFVSHIAYDDIGGLETGPNVDRDRDMVLPRYSSEQRVFWLDTSFGREIKERNETSYENPEEARFINAELRRINAELEGSGQPYSVGVIAPYAKQIARLTQEIVPDASTWKNLQIDIDTVDAFQGKQKDIMIYSMTRTSTGRPWRFIADRQRLNVAFSRAKRLLIIAGHLDAAKNTPELWEIINRISEQNIRRIEGVVS